MKKLFLLLFLLAATSCQKTLEPDVENINSIFATQDFQIKFAMGNGDEYRMGFLNNEIAYFSPQETMRRELSYDDVRLINTFVQNCYRDSETELELEPENEMQMSNSSTIEIYNDSKKVVFTTGNYHSEFEQLLTKLNLPYVSTTPK